MSRVTAVIATTNKISLNPSMGTSEAFANTALEEMAKTAIGKPVTKNFDANNQVGEIVDARVEGNVLVVEIETTQDLIMEKGMRVSPEITVKKFASYEPENHVEFSGVSVAGATFTTLPADLTLPPIILHHPPIDSSDPAERLTLSEREAYAFVDSVEDKADHWHGTAPLWHGWALREAFLTGVEFQKKRSQ